jgi:hypothetical protein
MPEGELAFGDESDLASLIRRALGIGPYEKLDVVTPQFERDDGIEVKVRPMSADHLDRLKRLPDDVLRRIGVGVWDKGDDWTHYLFPAEWYECIPAGYSITDINGETEAFVPGETDDDRRGGMLSYGWIAREHLNLKDTANPE